MLNLRTVALFALSLPVAVQAQSEQGKAWSSDAELGFVQTAGNSDTKTVNGKVSAKHEHNVWREHINFSALNSAQDNETSAEKYLLNGKLDYLSGEKSYWFATASFEADRFSGYDYQAVIAAGYGARLLDDAIYSLDIEAGPGYRENKLRDQSGSEEDVIFRVAEEFGWVVSDSAKVAQSLSVEAGGDNTISRFETSLKSKINGSFSMKLSYMIKYSEEVPAGDKHADTETGVRLVYSF